MCATAALHQGPNSYLRAHVAVHMNCNGTPQDAQDHQAIDRCRVAGSEWPPESDALLVSLTSLAEIRTLFSAPECVV